MEIIKHTDNNSEVLYKVAENVTLFDDELKKDIFEMIKCLALSKNGIALAAPQVGISKRFFIMQIDYSKYPELSGSSLVTEFVSPASRIYTSDELGLDLSKAILPVINPVIIEATGKMKYAEGCLSFPDVTLNRVRKSFIKIAFKNINNEDCVISANGRDAVCIQHECQHLMGETFLDYKSMWKKA